MTDEKAAPIELYKPPTAGMAFFDERIEGEIDLVEEVVKLFRLGGILSNKIDLFLNNHLIVSAKNKPAMVQRHLINRWSTLQLNTSSLPTMNEKYVLVPNGELSHWLAMYKESIVPFFVRADLPVDYSKAHLVRTAMQMVERAG